MQETVLDFINSLPLEQKILNLSSRNLVTFPEEVHRLINLERIYLDGNQLSELPNFACFRKLKFLNLSRNNFEVFPMSQLKDNSIEDLNISGNQLVQLPNLSDLASLRYLDLCDNSIDDLEGICENRRLRHVDLRYNKIRFLPEDMSNLATLQVLDLGNNELELLPTGIASLQNLEILSLEGNNLGNLPPSMSGLSNLRELYISDNMIDYIPKLGKMIKLETLVADETYGDYLFKDASSLMNLKRVSISGARLKSIPVGLLRLKSLESLNLSKNNLGNLPANFSTLEKLTTLDISENSFKDFPACLLDLQNLESINLDDNQLSEVPSNIDAIEALKDLSVQSNYLRSLPDSIGLMANLSLLKVQGNSFLVFPPPEIVEQGLGAIKIFLNSKCKDSVTRWTSKLLIVGEGGVGKSCTLNALKGGGFEPKDTTHGIEIDSLLLKHPTQSVEMRLNAWDFGGQEIYHATHQFFLTDKSLFLLVWNARNGFEAGKLDYWLKTIVANAPESPIIVVATHVDQREAELPIAALKEEFPQIEAFCKISNTTGAGLEELKSLVSQCAAKLPLMGQSWPHSWALVSQRLSVCDDKYITPAVFKRLLGEAGVQEAEFPLLSLWLHELGEILYFREQKDLKDIVILKPKWVSEYISRILDSPEVIEACGVLSLDCMERVWSDLDAHLRFHFVSLMEKFDLSYRIFEGQEVSLIVERLPLDPPPYETEWKSAIKFDGNYVLSMRFSLSDVLPGIPTWFIARQYRFSTGVHWRSGVLFADGVERKHLGLIKLERDHQTNGFFLSLKVVGPMPINFFCLLRDGIELTLKRYPGLRVTRLLPCPNSGGGICDGQFDFDRLSEALMLKKSTSAQCHSCWNTVSLRELLFGLHSTTSDQVIEKLGQVGDTVLSELATLSQRNLMTDIRLKQAELESICPSVFSIQPDDREAWKRDLHLDRVYLQLYCEAPGNWHPANHGGRYIVSSPKKWLEMILPVAKKVCGLLKYAAPILAPGSQLLLDLDLKERQKSEFSIFEQVVERLPGDISENQFQIDGVNQNPEQIMGSALRQLCIFLKQLDPSETWGGLSKCYTPEGHCYWLCASHAKDFSGQHVRNFQFI